MTTLPEVDRLGWDIGGVHLKVAALSAGQVVATAQAPYQIRRGLGVVGDALAALPDWARSPARHAVTMTAELSALFDDRPSGVAALTAWARRHLEGPMAIYGGRAGFLETDAAADHAHDVASANWHGTAAFLATRLDSGLLVDIGSTTTDIVPIEAGAVAARGYSDGERLREGELVYTGAIRTPIAALADRLPFGGRWVGLVAENFATVADAHRLAGGLPEGADQHETADGRDKSLAASRARLARIVGLDQADAPDQAWDALAREVVEAQLRRLHDAAALVLSRRASGLPPVLVGCGAGRFIARRLADRLDLDHRDFAALVPVRGEGLEHEIATCGPAVAIACLAEAQGV